MVKKTSTSLKETARRLGVKDSERSHLRNAYLEYVDNITGSRQATMNLTRDKFVQYREGFIEEPVAAKYATILEDLDSDNGHTYSVAMPLLEKLANAWFRNLDKKKPPQKTVGNPKVNISRPAIIDMEEEEDISHVLQHELETQSISVGRIQASGSDILLPSVRDETVRPDTPDIATATDEDAIHLRPSANQLRNRSSSPSNQLRLESNELSNAGSSNTKRRYEEIVPDEQMPEDPEEQTDDEQDEQQRQEVLRARAGKRVRHDEPESSLIQYSETPARTPVFSNVLGSARHTPLLPHQPSPSGDELKAWLNLFLLTIRERQRFVRESPEAANLSVDEQRFLEFVLKTFNDLESDLQEIAAKISPRLA